MKLTKKEALEKCRDMWQWLAENPGKIELDYFECFKGIPESDIPRNRCYFCEECNVNCRSCLGRGLWRRCTNEGSVYSDWLDSSAGACPIAAKKAAQQIADFCSSELKKLE